VPTYYVFLPEAVLVATALASVVLGFAWSKRPTWLWTLSLSGVGIALLLTLDLMGLGIGRALGQPLWPSPVGAEGDFAATLRVRVDPFALFFHVVFLFVAFLSVLASRGFVKPDEPHQGEYYGLVLLSVVGMMFTAAATDLFVLFLAFETSSLSLFALVAFRKKDRQATEAAVKFFIIGAVSSAIILFGISLVYGAAGTAFAGSAAPAECVGNLTSLSCLNLLTVAAYPQVEPPLIVALVFLIAGFGFKVAVVPFHMWAPDVYQGSPTTVSAFLAAGSKKVGVVAMFRVFLVGLLGVQVDWITAIAILAIATQTVGNVLAIPQRSVKRMLAYSSIAQAGYILIAIPVAAVAAQAGDPTMGALAQVVAVAGLVGGLLHVLTHAAMKAGSFLVVAGTETSGIPDDMDSYRGLGRRMPFLAFSMTIFLLSLAGIPPLGGFFSKFILFSSAVSAMAFNPWFLALAVSGVLNSALSLYYYARVIWYMYILEPDGAAVPVAVPRSITAGVAISLAVVILVTFLVTFFYDFLAAAATGFFGF
jgi:NADH-quinone oxidoreductase subunit N